MSLQLSDVLTAVRDRHGAFHKSRITNAVLARFYTDYQNDLLGKCIERDKMFLRQAVGIALNVNDANDPGTVGAGTSGALPADASATPGQIAVVQESAGALVELAQSVADGQVVMVPERVVSSATANDVTSTGAGRTANQDVGRIVSITSGKGKGQTRAVLSNTATTWVISTGSDGKQWATTPDATSLLQILAANLLVNEDMGVVTEVPALSTRTGYMVRIDASGAPFLDYTKPLSVSLDRGVPLPSLRAIVGGTVRYTDGDEDLLTITSYGRRYETQPTPAIYVAGESVCLCGTEDEWQDVASIELLYAPVAPAFTAVTDYFLLPDAARSALVEKGAAYAAARVNGLEGITLDVDDFQAKGVTAEGDYLKTLRLSKRARVTTFRGGAY